MGRKAKQQETIETLRRQLTIEHLRAFEAAKVSRRTDNWFTNNNGPNADLRLSLQRIITRHQDLVDSDPWASKAISVICNNWVGDGITGAPQDASKRFNDGYREWAESIECDWYEQLNFYGLQSQVARTVAVRGSALVRRRINESLIGKGLVPLQLQVLEPDWLDVSKDDGARIKFGKEYEANGKLRGYWIRRSHPGESDWTAASIASSDFVPASEICHVYDVRRPGQATGVPFGVAALLKLRDVSDRDAAQLLKDKLAACFMAFRTQIDSDLPLNPTDAKDPLEKLEPGLIYELKPGENITLATPPGSGDYVSAQKFQLLSIAQAYEITYEALTGDLSMVNFSSGRMGRMEMRAAVARWRWGIMIPGLLNRVAGWYRDAAAISGVGRVTNRFEWTPPITFLVDPAREIPAYIDAVRAGFMSLSEIQRQLGYVPALVIKELGQDLAAARAAGLKLDVDLAQTAGTVRPVATEPQPVN